MATCFEAHQTIEKTTEVVMPHTAPSGLLPVAAHNEVEASIVMLGVEADQILAEIALLQELNAPMAQTELDMRPIGQMSEWPPELDAESRAIHADLFEASLRALGDD